ncbi:MAG: ComF family protein, partial [Lachnospiraceae bacterium]|nr:ComF family protein [Lachnospiraceae bacterium]
KHSECEGKRTNPAAGGMRGRERSILNVKHNEKDKKPFRQRPEENGGSSWNGRHIDRRAPEGPGAYLQRAARWLRPWGEALAELLYPSRCPLCSRLLKEEEKTDHVCRACAEHLPWIRGPVCLQCGKPVKDERVELCPGCEKRVHLYRSGASAFAYEGELRDAMVRFKFHNKRENACFFARAMAREGKRQLQLWKPAVILPVPMHRRKRRRRGYDQAVLLAKALSREIGIPVRTDLLARTRLTRAQKRLGLEERRQNLRGAFVVRKTPVPEPVLLVDDIYTSGTTVDCVCETLREKGVEEIYVLTACITVGRIR